MNLLGTDVNPFYLGAFCLYLLIILAIGAWAYAKTETKDDFWVYGRELGTRLATWSLVANFFSAVALIGTVGEFAQVGYYILLTTQFGLVLGVAVAYFLSHRIRAFDEITLSDIIATMTGREYARPITGTILFINSFIFIILQLVGGSVLVTTITGVPYRYMVWVIGVVFIGYTVVGGLASIAWTDLLQGTLMFVLMICTAGFLLVDLGGFAVMNQQFATMDPAHVNPLGETETMLGAAGLMLAFFGSVLTNQTGYILINATEDVKSTKSFLATGGMIIGFFLVVTVILGVGTAVALDNAGITVSDPDRAFPVMITQVLPTSIGTIVILGLMSAILSTTDTRLHALGVTFTRDIYDYFRPNASDSHQLRVSRYTTLVFGLLATAISADPPGTIFLLFKLQAVILTTGVLVPLIAGLYWRDVDGRTLITSMVVGAVCGIVAGVAGGTVLGIPATIFGAGAALVALPACHLTLGGEPRTANQPSD